MSAMNTSDLAFERLYRQHRGDVYRFVLRDVRNPEEAEDVTQTAFLNAYRAIQHGEEPERPRAWLLDHRPERRARALSRPRVASARGGVRRRAGRRAGARGADGG